MFEKKTWTDRVSEYPTRRKLIKEDGTSEIVTVERCEGNISAEGDAFSADNMNGLEERVGEALSVLSATDGTEFRFGVNEKGEYGYVVEKDGADTVIPFSNARKLYEALEHSGLVTEDMSFDEMCEVLSEYFPEIYKLYMSSANEGGFEAFNEGTFNNSNVTFADTMNIVSTVYASTSIACVTSSLIDVTRFNSLNLNFNIFCPNGKSDSANYCKVFLTKEKEQTMDEYECTYLATTETNVSGTKSIDISSLEGNFYIVIMLKVGAGSGETRTINAEISNMYME